MPTTKVEEKKLEEGITVGYEMKLLEPSSTEEYTLWSVEKLYGNVDFLAKTDKFMTGYNLVPAYGRQILVAFPHDDIPIMEKLPKGVIQKKAFDHQVESLADSFLAYRKRVLDEGKPVGF